MTPKKYLEARRQFVLSKLKANEVLLLMAPPVYIRSSDDHFPFRQSSDFLYLGAWERENSALVIDEGKIILFIERPTPKKILWDGHVPDIDEARVKTFIQDVRYIEELSGFLRGLTDKVLYYEMGKHKENDLKILDYSFQKVISPRELMGSARLVKDEWELDLLRKASDFSCKAHKEIWGQVNSSMNESEFTRELEYYFKRFGCQRSAYTPIVASGKNATCLHYKSNNAPMKAGDLLLVDAAGEFNYYNSDITRTFSVDGPNAKRSDEQQQIYEIVLNVQLKAIELARVGLSLKRLHLLTVGLLEEALLSAGILKDKAHIKSLYPHGTGHWLGLDVHDECPREINNEEVQFAPGMVCTIEPGLYFYGEMADLYPKYAGIGVRIEDDIIITDGHPEVMTSSLVK